MPIPFPSEMNTRESPLAALDLLMAAESQITALSKKYSMLASSKEVQQIYALLDGAIYKLSTIKEKLENGEIVDSIPEDAKSTEPSSPEDDKPLTGGDILKAVFGYLTSDE